MAKARMLHKKISISLDVNKLPIEGQLLFTWLISHADDDGRIKGEPEYIKATVVPMKNWSANKVNTYLEQMKNNGLIYYWQEDNGRFIEFPKWKDFQTIQNDRYKKSDLPSFLKIETNDVDTGRIQPGYKMDTQSNISESNAIEINKSEFRGMERKSEGKPNYIADKKTSFKRVSDIQNPNALLDPSRYQSKNAEEAAAKEVWFKLEPNNRLAFSTTYLNAARKGVPASVIYQFCSEIRQDKSIMNPGAVFQKKVNDYLDKKGLQR